MEHIKLIYYPEGWYIHSNILGTCACVDNCFPSRDAPDEQYIVFGHGFPLAFKKSLFLPLTINFTLI